MSDEKRALTRHSAPPSEADYEAILAAVMETGRGRWFLHEFAQRNRHTETRGVLSAIQRIEGLLRAQSGEIADDFGQPSAEQIGAAIARAQEMLRGGSDDTTTAFDGVVQSLESARARIRVASGRLQDASHALREAGGHYRICKDLDQQIVEVNAGGAQLDDTAGDVRILVALLNEIESQIGERQSDRLTAMPSQNEAAPVTAASASDAAIDVAPDVRIAPAAAEPVHVDSEAIIAEESIAADIVGTDAIDVDAAETALASPPALVPEPAAGVVQTRDDDLAPDDGDDPVLPGDPITGPADFLFEPLSDDEPAEDPAPRAPEPVIARQPESRAAETKPAAPLRLDSFDPLAPIRALSDEEKIALFS